MVNTKVGYVKYDLSARTPAEAQHDCMIRNTAINAHKYCSRDWVSTDLVVFVIHIAQSKRDSASALNSEYGILSGDD